MSALPTSKLERWKYSNLPAFVGQDYDVQPLSVGYSGDESFIAQDDLSQSLWASDVYQDMALWDGMQDVLSIVIPEDKSVDNPVYIRVEEEQAQVKSEGAIHIHLCKNASLTLHDFIECGGWINRSMHITLEEGAELIHIRQGRGQGVVTSLVQVHQAANSTYNEYTLNNYSSFMRDQIHVRLSDENAKCYLSGAKVLSGDQHCDTCILIEHEAPNCYSNQNYRNILNDQSRGVFQGKVHVHQIAQQTDGYQLCNSILLSDKCEMDTKPELEIYADDVKCSHGATTAQLDEDPLFYLQARGIPKDEAQALLLQAFIAESLEALEDKDDVYSHLSGVIAQSLSGRHCGEGRNPKDVGDG